MKRLQQEAQNQKNIEDKRLKFFENAIKKLGDKAISLEKTKTEYEEKKQKKDDTINRLKSSSKTKDDKIFALEKNLLKEKNVDRKRLRVKFYEDKIRKWRLNSWLECLFALSFVLGGFVYFFIKGDWDFDVVATLVTEFKADFWISLIFTIIGFFVTTIAIPSLINKYRNHSNIENFKKGLELPEELEYLNELPQD